MTEAGLREALREHVTLSEPPLRLDTPTVIRAGRRSLRYRRLAYCGGAAALAGLLALTANAVASRRDAEPVPAGVEGPDRPTVTAAPDPRTCEQLRGTPIGAGATESERAARVSCYLVAAVPAALPSATFADNALRRTPFLVAIPDADGLSATAYVTTPQGKGMVNFLVSRSDPPDDDTWQEQCTGEYTKAICTTGPHGEKVQIFDMGADPLTGTRGWTIYLYSGHTQVLAGARNADESQNAEPTMPAPPLSIEQLIQLAASPELVVYP